MSDRGVLTVGIALFLVALLVLIAYLAPSMRRLFWIAELAIGLLMFGAVIISIAVHMVDHRSIAAKALFSLIFFAYLTWSIAQYLYDEIGRSKPSLKQTFN